MPLSSPTADLSAATGRLADALVAVWDECNKLNRDVAGGPNVSEELSLALAVASRRIIRRTFPDAKWPAEESAEAETLRRLGAEILVKHRPGCWEASHVRALMFPLDLLEPDA